MNNDQHASLFFMGSFLITCNAGIVDFVNKQSSNYDKILRNHLDWIVRGRLKTEANAPSTSSKNKAMEAMKLVESKVPSPVDSSSSVLQIANVSEHQNLNTTEANESTIDRKGKKPM